LRLIGRKPLASAIAANGPKPLASAYAADGTKTAG
jgi:hypothetical protein